MIGHKKEISDFLREWANAQNANWALLLVEYVIKNSSYLSEEDRRTVFDGFLQDIGIKESLPLSDIEKQEYKPTENHIALSSISGVEGVSKLAKNQTIDFSPTITIIYGENGAGKTSYGKILKSLGFSYDNSNIILNDVFGSHSDVKALIKFESNETAKEFQWNNRDKNEELKSISTFNEDCVKISFNQGRELLVSPMGFHLFQVLSSELDKLRQLSDSELNLYTTSLSFASQLHQGTEQYTFITNMKLGYNENELLNLSLFYESHNISLTDSQKN